MISFLYDNLLHKPLYNILVFLSFLIPGQDFGVAIITLTVLVKALLFPLSHKSVKTQAKMRELEAPMKEIKEKYKDDNQQQAIKIMNLYKEHGVNPFSGILLLFIQIPIILALYFLFRGGIDLSSPDIYSFVPKPDAVNSMFLGVLDIAKPSYFLAILVGVTQFIQAKFAVPSLPKQDLNKPVSFQEEFARSMQIQTKYFLPIFIAFVATKLNAGISLYWITNNIISIGHELLVKRKAKMELKGK